MAFFSPQLLSGAAGAGSLAFGILSRRNGKLRDSDNWRMSESRAASRTVLGLNESQPNRGRARTIRPRLNTRRVHLFFDNASIDGERLWIREYDGADGSRKQVRTGAPGGASARCRSPGDGGRHPRGQFLFREAVTASIRLSTVGWTIRSSFPTSTWGLGSGRAVTKGRTTHGCAGSMLAVCRLPQDKSERSPSSDSAKPSGNAPTAGRNNYGSMASSRKNHDNLQPAPGVASRGQ